MVATVSPNAHGALLHRLDTGTLTWHGPALMLLARGALAVPAQALVAAILALRGSPSPWLESAAWLPVYGTLIDMGCLRRLLPFAVAHALMDSAGVAIGVLWPLLRS